MSDILYLGDGYKLSHHNQFDPNAEKLFYYYESRGGIFTTIPFFGLQYYLLGLEDRINERNVKEAAYFYKEYYPDIPFNEEGWLYIANERAGQLPISIRALPEGTMAPNNIPLFTVESTDDKVPWIVGWVETYLSLLWYPLTVGALSYACKNVLRKTLVRTSDLEGDRLEEHLSYKLHDFGARGVSSVESGSIGAAAHLLHFNGSDTVKGAMFLRDYYFLNKPFSTIPSMEHSTITSWGKDNEENAYRNMIEKYGDFPYYGIVVDSYDMWNAIKNILGKKLKPLIDNKMGILIIRVDSGDPNIIVPATLETLSSIWGFTTNSKGKRVLNNRIRVLQGDGMELHSIESLFYTLEVKGWSAENVNVGMGGGLLQKVNRDDLKFAYKCSAKQLGDKTILPVFKDPITDPKKASKKGLLWVDKNFAVHSSSSYANWSNNPLSILGEVYRNGNIIETTNYTKIMKNIKESQNWN